MSRSLQSSIRAMRQKEVTDDNLPQLCAKIVAIQEENLQELPFEALQGLVEIATKIKRFMPYSEKIRAYKNKETLKHLSNEISGYIHQMNTFYPLPQVDDSHLQNLSYHELEELAKQQQTEIETLVKEIDAKKKYVSSISGYLYHNLKVILQPPEFKLMLFEYPEGIPALFPHEDLLIEVHRHKLETEISTTQNFLQSKYGVFAIEKITETRKKWDLDYSRFYEQVEKKLESVTKFSSEILDDSVSVHNNYSFHAQAAVSLISSPVSMRFIEGGVTQAVESVLVEIDTSWGRFSGWYSSDTEKDTIEGVWEAFPSV
jgi:hypothetical protein